MPAAPPVDAVPPAEIAPPPAETALPPAASGAPPIALRSPATDVLPALELAVPPLPELSVPLLITYLPEQPHNAASVPATKTSRFICNSRRGVCASAWPAARPLAMGRADRAHGRQSGLAENASNNRGNPAARC